MIDKSHWPRVKFGDVIRQVKDKVDPKTSGLERFIAGEHMETDDLRIRRWGEIGDDYLGPAFHMRFKAGQVLYGSRRTYLRKVAVPDFEGITANTTFVLEPKDPNLLLPELLPFIMQTESFNDHSIKQSKGSVNPYVNFSDLAWYEFALPPLEEQRRIAEVLWTVEDTATLYSGAISAIKSLIQSHTVDFISRFDDARFARRVSRLLKDDPKNGYSPRTNDSKVGLRTVSISSISDGEFVSMGNEKYADVDLEKVASFLVRKGDVYVVRGNGNLHLAGKCGMALTSYDDLFYPDLLIRLRFDKDVILPRFAVLQWNSPMVHRNLISRAKSTNGIWKINGQDVRKHTLVVPPVSEQVQFLAKHDELASANSRLRTRLSEVADMKRRLLDHKLQVEHADL